MHALRPQVVLTIKLNYWKHTYKKRIIKKNAEKIVVFIFIFLILFLLKENQIFLVYSVYSFKHFFTCC